MDFASLCSEGQFVLMFNSGGTLTLKDLASFRATVSDAWAVPLGEYEMYIPPPPAGGVLLSLILNIMKGLYCALSHTLSYNNVPC